MQYFHIVVVEIGLVKGNFCITQKFMIFYPSD